MLSDLAVIPKRRQSLEYVMDVMQEMYARMGVDMSAQSTTTTGERETYVEHVGRIESEARDIVFLRTFSIVMRDVLTHVYSRGGMATPEEAANEATQGLFCVMERMVMFVTLHLVDRGLVPHTVPRAPGSDTCAMLDGRFGRTDDWLVETGVPHGRWPVDQDSETDVDE